jgi:hypothetical protein
VGYLLIIWAFIIGWGPFKHEGDFSQRDLIQIGIAVLIGIAGVVLAHKESDDE